MTPSVTVVFLVYNRREELRESLGRMMASDYEGQVSYIVVDNASEDGSGAMVREDFPDVQLIANERNVGVSGWNAGFAAAKGDWVLALDDDCYLPPDGLRRAVAAAQQHQADLVSFRVVSTHDPGYFFNDEWNAGLFSFWGCAVLIRATVLKELGGYDPEIFVYSNETELMVRLLDSGYKHLYFPEVVAQHMKEPPRWKPPKDTDMRPRHVERHHRAYTAAKLFRLQDAGMALVAMVAFELRDGLRVNWRCALAAVSVVTGFVHGLRHRRPVGARTSREYGQNCSAFAGPWQLSRPPGVLARALFRKVAQRRTTEERRPPTPPRRDEYFARRARYYPDGVGALQL